MRLLLLLALALGTLAARAEGPRLELLSEITWREPWEHFGGFSGIEVDPGGDTFLAMTDRGRWVRGNFTRDREGNLERAGSLRRGRLHGVDGTALEGGDVDSEGLAIDSRGRAYISFENNHRVRRYDDLAGPATSIRSHPDFAGLQQNSGLESLAIDAAGTLYAIPERSGALTRPFPVYRLRDGAWDRSWQLRRDGTFLPSDAAFGPDGKLYLLERDFKWLGGFATRVRRFAIGPDGLEDEVTLLETRFGELDNMEGISVWRDADGRIRVTLVADDNFFPLQRTMFAEYLLVDG